MIMSMTSCTPTLNSLLSRAILQPYPAVGPTILDLVAAAFRLVFQSQDFSSLMEEMDWKTEQSNHGLVHLMRSRSDLSQVSKVYQIEKSLRL